MAKIFKLPSKYIKFFQYNQHNMLVKFLHMKTEELRKQLLKSIRN